MGAITAFDPRNATMQRRDCVFRPDAYLGDRASGPTMIRHIVFFTARDRRDLDQIVEGLELLATIPHSLHFEVVQNSKVDQIGNDVDVVVYGEFVDEAALAAYKAHPTYAEATKRVRPLRELRLAADIRSNVEAAALKRSA